MKIKSIEIQNMHKVVRKTYNLEDVTYFHGLNGAGKTTVLQAIQLALLGYIPGTNKTGVAIMRHANSPTMTVSLEFDNGVSISRTWLQNRSSVQSSVVINPPSFDLETLIADLELPIFNFSQFVGMSANKLKEWFINYLPNADSEIDWKDELSKCVSMFDSTGDVVLTDADIFHKAVNFASSMPQTLEGIQRVNNYMKEQVQFYTSQIKQSESTIRSLVHYDDVIETDNIEDLKVKQRELVELHAKVSDAKAKQLLNEGLLQRLESEFSEWNLCEDMKDDPRAQIDAQKAEDRKSKIQKLYEKHSELRSQIAEYKAAIQGGEHLIASGGVCTYTGERCEAIQKLINDITKSVEDNRSKLTEAQARLAKFEDQVAKLNQEEKAEQTAVMRIQQMYQRRDDLKSRLVEVNQDYDNYDVSVLKSEIDRLSDSIAKVSANLEYNRLIETITADKYKLEQELLALKEWAKLTDANHLQTTVSHKQFAALAAKLTKYIGIFFNEDDVSADFYISDKANSFSFGLRRGKSYIPFDLLSSGERCIYTLALMICILEASNSEFKVVLIDDLLDHLDTEKFNKLFETLLEETDVQIILAGVQPVVSNNGYSAIIEIV